MSQELQEQLSELESALQRAGVWDTQPPSSEALASELPFCVDTLHFQQWLQWVYIPRLRALIEANAPLPQGCNMLPYAQESFVMQKLENMREVLVIIARCDRLLS